MNKLPVLAMFIFSALSFNNVSAAEVDVVPDIEGKEVVDNAGEVIGEVDRVAKSKTMEAMVVIGLNDSQKEVAVPLASVKVAADGAVSTSLTRAQLESYEDIDPLDFTRMNPTPNKDD